MKIHRFHREYQRLPAEEKVKLKEIYDQILALEHELRPQQLQLAMLVRKAAKAMKSKEFSPCISSV